MDETTPPATEEPGTETIPAEQTATGFSLSQTEFSFSNTYPYPVTLQVTFTPAGTTGTITWTSSNPDIASVDDSGVVYHGTQTGTATITASMPRRVRRDGHGLQLRHQQRRAGPLRHRLRLGHHLRLPVPEPHRLHLQRHGQPVGADAGQRNLLTPTWSVSDTSVATISADGVVRPAGPGTATITCTVDGQSLTCIVRCNF